MLQIKSEHLTEKIPLRADTHGTIRVGDTRVTLSSVIACFDRGATPVAALRVIPPLCQKYLRAMGVSGMPLIFTSFHQWMGVFPADQVQALALMAAGVLTAVLGQATKLISKTFQEARGIPTPEANASSMRFCQELLRYGVGSGALRLPEDRLEEECYWLTQEVDALLAAVGNLGTEDLVEAIAHAFATGQLDIPFPANPEARGAIIPARALDGSIRYLEIGNLPFNDAIRAFHRRQLASKHSQDLHSLVADIYFISPREHAALYG